MEIIMITLTKLNEKEFVLNDDLIQTMEETPDTVITLTNGIKYVVKENCEEIKTKIIEYKRMIFASDKY
jgi:flagellar protein FlbD